MKEQTTARKPEIKLLVVDDREDNLMSIETILERDRYTIVKANSGRAALKILLKEHDFTLILMDVQMPDLSGFETASMIYERDKLKHIPIIFITANDYGDESVFKGYQAGGVDYISKPINSELLRAKVSVFVELYTKTHQLIAQEQKLIAANKNLEREIEERTLSEQKVQLLNSQLMDNIMQLKATNEELERFAYVASHDLQEPLRKIIIFGDRLAAKYKDALSGDGSDYIDRMKRASERMQSLIKNILAFSKAVESPTPLEETDLNKLVDEVLSDLQVYIEQKKALFSIGKLPTIKVIPGQFRQLMQNLIVNSLKFSKEDAAPVVTITAEKIKGMNITGISTEQYDEPYWKISISDNGIGFDEKYAEQIFMIFKRLHSFDQFEGTGIGLSICKKIVEKHNGFISASSRPGHGATFNIIIPQKQQEQVVVEPQVKKKLLA